MTQPDNDLREQLKPVRTLIRDQNTQMLSNCLRHVSGITFPEKANANPGYDVKDRLENKLHDLVCAGSLTLRSAQREIAAKLVLRFIPAHLRDEPLGVRD